MAAPPILGTLESALYADDLAAAERFYGGVLGLEGPGKVAVQVCTFKGGIEAHMGKELPRETERDGRLVCDMADTFGPENTTERLEKDRKPDKPFAIQGHAAILQPPQPPEPEEPSEPPEEEAE